MKISAYIATITLWCSTLFASPEALKKFIHENWDQSVRVGGQGRGIVPIPIPHTVPSPSGNFKAQFYWDTYFTNLGLLESGRVDLAKSNCDALLWWLTDKDFVPNSAFIGDDNRSQPPLLSEMVREVYQVTKDKQWLAQVLPLLEKEHAFWIKNRTAPSGLAHFGNSASKEYLLRFYDAFLVNRLGLPSSADESVKLARANSMLSEAESGEDFTPIFEGRAEQCEDVKLNCILSLYERNIAFFMRELGRSGEDVSSWENKSNHRASLIRERLWDEKVNGFRNRNFVTNSFVGGLSADTFYPLWSKIATATQAEFVYDSLRHLEFEHGLSQGPFNDAPKYQWAYPVVWPPTQWIAFVGLRNYRYDAASRRLASKYCSAQEALFKESGHLWEKYDVRTGRPASGEYESDNMLGWTAGVYLALKAALESDGNITVSAKAGKMPTSTLFIDTLSPGAPIAPICRGQQVEEFNHQFEGGFYSQLVANPSFEEVGGPAFWNYDADRQGLAAFDVVGADQTSQINESQSRCLRVRLDSAVAVRASLTNRGYWGVALKAGAEYRIRFWAKADSTFSGGLRVSLLSGDGQRLAQSDEFQLNGEWRQFGCTLIASGVPSLGGQNQIRLDASGTGTFYLDMLTAMPPTWKNRPNGVREDLGMMLDALKLKYLQFPGGCAAESYKSEERWNWRGSIGALHERSGSTRDRWNYRNHLFFGIDEYFQLCEDIGAQPIYTAPAGISESSGSKWYGVCGINELLPIIEDTLSLIEYANGDVNTHWGKIRAENGHPTPYGLRYIEIGNEHAMGWTGTRNAYFERYEIIRSAILERYPSMQIMVNGKCEETGPYDLSGVHANFVDEHFYGKDLTNLYHRYDKIESNPMKVCVAEYATSSAGNGGNVIGNFGDSISDAIFMLGCEKNSSKLWWTGYGNFAGRLDHGDFGPCLIWYDSEASFGSPAYHMQKMFFSDNPGTHCLPFELTSESCFVSVSTDGTDGKNHILIKVVNKSAEPESLEITLNGVGEGTMDGSCTAIVAHPGDENTLFNPLKVSPVIKTIRCAAKFTHSVEGNSIQLLRINLGS